MFVIIFCFIIFAVVVFLFREAIYDKDSSCGEKIFACIYLAIVLLTASTVICIKIEALTTKRNLQEIGREYLRGEITHEITYKCVDGELFPVDTLIVRGK